MITNRRFAIVVAVGFALGLASAGEVHAQRRGGAVRVAPGAAWAPYYGGYRGGVDYGRSYYGGRAYYGPRVGVGVYVPYSPYYGYGGTYPDYYYGAPNVYYSTPSYPYVPPSTLVVPSHSVPFPASPAAPSSTATLNIRLPANARLFFDDVEATGQSGSLRRFVSPPLVPGETYRYVLRAQWFEGGTLVERTREVTVRAGQTVDVDFGPQAA